MQFGMPTLIELDSSGETYLDRSASGFVHSCGGRVHTPATSQDSSDTSSIRRNASLCRELGLDFVELNMNLPCCATLGDDDCDSFIKELNEIQNEFGVFFTIHLDENLNIADFNNRVAEAYTNTVLSAIRNAQRIGAPTITMHMNRGVYFTMPNEKVFLLEKYRAHYLSCFDAFATICHTEITNPALKICIENTDGWLGFEKEAIQLLLERPCFGLTFDIGHSHAAGNPDEEYIIRNNERIAHFHIHDATSYNHVVKIHGKNHLALGTGSIELQRYLSLAQNHGARCVLETKTALALRDSVDWLARNFPLLEI